MATCFFIGHRDAPEELLPLISDAAERLITDCDVTAFYVGGYGAFDRIAGRAVVVLKKKYSHIRLYRVIAYHPAERPQKAPKGYDGTYYPPGMEEVPHRVAIPRANQAMIENSDYLIAYVRHDMLSNSYEVLRYAKRREQKGLMRVTNLADAEKLCEINAQKC